MIYNKHNLDRHKLRFIIDKLLNFRSLMLTLIFIISVHGQKWQGDNPIKLKVFETDRKNSLFNGLECLLTRTLVFLFVTNAQDFIVEVHKALMD